MAFLALIVALAAVKAREVSALKANWKFTHGNPPGAEQIALDDSSWQTVRVPHDWAIAGPFQPEGDPNTGKLPWRGEGWYRKPFPLATAQSGQRVLLLFEGVMAFPEVYVNGRKAGGWDYGYNSFWVDATELVRFGATNLLAVHADTRRHGSRWYPGAGIYRNVTLYVVNPVSVAPWGVYVTTPTVTTNRATVRVRTTVANHLAEPADVEVEVTLLAPDGSVAGSTKQPLTVPAESSADSTQDIGVAAPQLWDVDSPQLYEARTKIMAANRVTDEMATTFGIRSFQWTANDGFHLNGRRLQLKGVESAP